MILFCKLVKSGPMRFFYFMLFFLFLPFLSSAQEKVIVKTHANGKPHVVYYMKGKGESAQKVKEEVYYENGKLEYSGEYKNGIENGEWRYYYENGNLKAIEVWKNGVENGTWKEYHPDGRLARELIYKNGKLVDTIVHK